MIDLSLEHLVASVKSASGLRATVAQAWQGPGYESA